MKSFLKYIFAGFMGAVIAAPVISVGIDVLPSYLSKITNENQDRIVDVEFLAGKNRLAVDANISSVNVPNGRDPIPDSYFTVLNTGAQGDTITVTVAGTANDPSTPDDDVPQCSKVFTTQAGEVGDEPALTARIINEIRSDLTWKNSCFLKAQRVKDRNSVHIFSTKFSLVAEFYERPNANDFDVQVTGTASVFKPYDNLVSRVKETSLAQDPQNPHNLGILGISGSVTVTPGALSSLFIDNPENGGSSDMRVDGSVTPVDFTIPCDTDEDIFVEELKFYISCNGLKTQNFGCLNSPLTNGVATVIQSDETITTLPSITTTAEFNNLFTFGGGDYYYQDVAGADQMQASFVFDNPFPIRACGTFTTDDSLKVTIQDDLSSGLLVFKMLAFGFKKEP